MKNIAIIPARSGSKGLKDKNIKLLNGKPLMAYTIEAAQKSNQFDEIFISTDSKEYAKIARKWGASVPFLRSEELSSDTASSWDVVSESLKKYEEFGQRFDSFALLQPTSPLRTSEDIVAGYLLMNEKKANAVVGVCQVEHSPLWCNNIPSDLSMEGFINKSVVNAPRQQLDTFYRINGSIYISKVDYFFNNQDIYEKNCYAYIMLKENSIDIDDFYDFIIAEALIQYKTKQI